jgi:AcrR family transcriptional regulator
MMKNKEQSARMRLLEGSYDLFAEKGLYGTDVAEICQMASVEEAAFEHCFSSKNALFRVVYEQIADEGLRVLITTMIQPGPPAERIDSTARATVRFMLEDERRARIFCVEAPKVRGEFEGHRSELLYRYAEALVSGTRLMGNVKLTDVQMRIGARAILAAMETLIAEHLRSPDEVSKPDCVRALSHICCSVAGVA